MSRDITGWQVQDSNLRRRKPTDLQSIPAVCDVCQLTGVEAGSELGLTQILVAAQRLSGAANELALTIG